MTKNVTLAGLAQAQAVYDAPADAITLHYDAARDCDGDPVVYAVLSGDDLCKLPTDLLSGLGIGADRNDVQGDPAFFVGDDETLRLYVDTDVYPNFKADLIDVAEDHGIKLYDAHGDLHHLTGGGPDIAVPDMPAFVHAGFERIDTSFAIAAISQQRMQDMRLIKRAANDDPGPELL
jgi:hypothetical protein